MSYSVSGVAAVSFPIQTLHNDAFSVPGSQRSITPQPLNTQTGVDLHATPNKVIAQAQPSAASSIKVQQAKHAEPTDTVTLSTSQKVRELQRQGESELQIAATLNLPAKEVLRDLNVESHVPQTFTVAPVSNALSGNTTATVSAPTV